MNREHQQDDLIDLGTVTEVTKGVAIGGFDVDSTLRPNLGLTDD